MTTVTVSPKFQIVIPARIRELFSLTPGQKLAVIPWGDRIELVPVLPLEAFWGIFPDIETTVERDDDRV
jgi:AbrB family looped-hinge helix DNA binding protein